MTYEVKVCHLAIKSILFLTRKRHTFLSYGYLPLLFISLFITMAVAIGDYRDTGVVMMFYIVSHCPCCIFIHIATCVDTC